MVSVVPASDLVAGTLVRDSEEQLRAALVREGNDPGEASDLLLRDLARPRHLSAFLREVMRDSVRAEQLAQSSHRHALGFDKFVLAVFGELGQLRMHVWWPDQERLPEHIHNHRFQFSSVVVSGRLRTRYYRTAERGVRHLHLRECSQLGDTEWRFQHRGVLTVAETLTADLAAGSCYSMPADLWHRVEAGATATVTLMLQRRSVRNWSSVLIGSTEQVPTRLPRRPFTPPELRQRLGALRELLSVGW